MELIRGLHNLRPRHRGCVATIGALRSEFGWRWAAFSGVYQLGLAWLLAVVVFQVGTFLGYA